MECNFIQLVVGTKDNVNCILYKPIKKAHWEIDSNDKYRHRRYCSNCNQTNSWGEVPFCPWCGADMRGDNNDGR